MIGVVLGVGAACMCVVSADVMIAGCTRMCCNVTVAVIVVFVYVPGGGVSYCDATCCGCVLCCVLI